MIPTSPPPRPGLRRRGVPLIIAGVFLVYLLASGLATLWTDYLWFQSVGFTVVWRNQILIGAALAAIGLLIAFLVLWTNLKIAEAISPRFELLDLGEDDEMIQRFHEWVDPRLRRVRLLVTVALSIVLGLGTVGWIDIVIRFFNRRSFGIADPMFGREVGFFVFQLPLIANVVGWIFNLFTVTLLVVAAVHYLNGGLRFRRGKQGVVISPKVKTHLSVLAALLALIRAGSYRIDAWQLVYSRRGATFGAGYTDQTVRLPALQLLAVISVLAAIILIWNVTRRGWTLAAVTVVSWVVVSVLVGQVVPAVFQRVSAEPNRLKVEAPFVERNIAFTRAGYGIDRILVTQFAASADLGSADLAANADIVDNLRLWDPVVIARTYRGDQGLRPFYRLDRVDTDRYAIDGRQTQVMVAARELYEDQIGATDWQSLHLNYTHGYGVVVSPANTVLAPQGQPDYLVKDVPPASRVPELTVDQPRIYFGETYQAGSPVFVATGDSPLEIDAPRGEGEAIARYRYTGQAGVDVGSFFRRLAFAVRYRDLNLLLSGQLTSDSKVLVERNVRALLARVAPFLEVDSDPYPVVNDGRIVWLVDLYTTSNAYPYSTPLGNADRDRLSSRSTIGGDVNYLRNSVKATIDAYDGTVELFIVDDADPVINVYDAAYPGIFKPLSDLDPALRSHLRYPTDLFTVQSEKYLLYHMDSPEEFLNEADVWQIPNDPSTNRRAEALRGDDFSPTTGVVTDYYDKMLPYYMLMRLPLEGETDASYVALQPFAPRDKGNMTSFLLADSDADTYGRLIDFRMPRNLAVQGPDLVTQRIQQDGEISQQITLWGQEGSEVVRGDLLVVPIEHSIVFVQPIYLEAENGGLPEFQRVIVVFNDRIEWRETLPEALAAVFGRGVDGEPTEPTDQSVLELLNRAAAAFAAADEALGAQDLAEYQRLVEEARRLIEEALRIQQDTTDAHGALVVG